MTSVTSQNQNSLKCFLKSHSLKSMRRTNPAAIWYGYGKDSKPCDHELLYPFKKLTLHNSKT